MEHFYNSWIDTQKIPSKEYICWNCSNLIASSLGYKNYNSDKIYICPHCNAPQIISDSGKIYPQNKPGNSLKNLPKLIEENYEEARACISVNAYTAAVMLLRKILMNLAVEEGAKENDSFSNYVKYLCDNGYVHKKQAQQAEKLKKLGNNANHQVESRTQAEATELLSFIELLLKNNYEYADPKEEANNDNSK